MTSPDPMAEIRASFFVECDELLEALQDGLQQIEDGLDDTETIHVIFRAVHSIKGGAGAFGLDGLVHFSHGYETVLDAVRAGRLTIDPSLLKVFFRAADHLSDLVRASRDGTEISETAGEDLLAEIASHTDSPERDTVAEPEIEFEPVRITMDLDVDDVSAIPDVSPGIPQYAIHFAPDAEMFENGNDAYPVLSALSSLGQAETTCDASKLPSLDKIAPETPYLSWDVVLATNADAAEIASVFEFVDGLCTYTINRIDDDCPAVEVSAAPSQRDPAEVDTTNTSAAITSAPIHEAAVAHSVNTTKSVVRVDLERIERLVNLVGELVINQAMLAQSLQSAELSPHSDAMNGLEEFQRLTRDIQDSVMMIRAQPVKSLFQRMSRIVREASAAVGKDVRLITEGDTTEIDKTVIERLADPLTHMIRNAVDHGLEDTEDRRASGKPAQGQVRLSAAHRSGRVIIEVADDGGGINREKVLKIASDKGLIPGDANLSDSEIDNLLFLPGFSTASAVSDLSGRGVGMDVVRNAIQSLGGRISITSEDGKGTTFSISLPLTLAVLDGMVVEVAGETLVLPLNVVSETLTLSDGTLETLQPGADIVRVRDGFVPLFDLGQMLGYRSAKDSYIDSVALLIMGDDGTQSALIVDEIQDQRQVVIKGLDETFYRAPGVAAATILGDGQIALIIDPSDIVRKSGVAAPSAQSPSYMEA